jgi:hypothetical protein
MVYGWDSCFDFLCISYTKKKRDCRIFFIRFEFRKENLTILRVAGGLFIIGGYHV